ncbi:Ser-tRNA(Ala) deacylase AlaX [Pseudomonas sp. YL-218 TE3947]
MTLRLFFHSDELKANVEVLECTPQENEFAVVLRATLFHPQGGGQPLGYRLDRRKPGDARGSGS